MQFDDIAFLTVICMGRFGVNLLASMSGPIFPAMLLKFNSNYSHLNATVDPVYDLKDYQNLGFLFMIKSLFQIFFGPLIGILIDKIGCNSIMMLGIWSIGLSIVLYGLGASYWLLLIGRVAESLGSICLTCGTIVLVSIRYSESKERGTMLGISSWSVALGRSVGPSFGGVVYEHWGKAVAYLSVLCLMVLEAAAMAVMVYRRRVSKTNTVIVLGTVEIKTPYETNGAINTSEPIDGQEDKATTKDKRKQEFNCFRSGMISFLLDPYFMLSLSFYLFVNSVFYMYLATLAVHMRLRFGATESQQGLVWTPSLAGYSLSFLVAGTANSRLRPRQRLFGAWIAAWLVALGTVGVALAPRWWAVALPLCVATSQMLTFEVLMLPLCSVITERRHGAQFGTMSGIRALLISITSAIVYLVGPLALHLIGFLPLNLIFCAMNIVIGPCFLFLAKVVQ